MANLAVIFHLYFFLLALALLLHHHFRLAALYPEGIRIDSSLLNILRRREVALPQSLPSSEQDLYQYVRMYIQCNIADIMY